MLTVATALVAVSTLAACAGSGGPEEDETNGTGDVSADTEATVRILMEEVPDTDIVQDLVPQFNEEYPDITIDIETLTFDQMRDRLVASFQSSDPNYDLIVVDNPWMVDFADAGFLEPLDNRIADTTEYNAEDFFDSLVDITTVDRGRATIRSPLLQLRPWLHISRRPL